MTANVHTAAAVQGLLETTSAPILSSSATVTTAAAAAATNAGTTADSSSSLLSSLLPTQLSTTQMAGGAAALCGAAALVIGYRRLGRRKTAGGSGEKGEKDNAPQSTGMSAVPTIKIAIFLSRAVEAPGSDSSGGGWVDGRCMREQYQLPGVRELITHTPGVGDEL